MMTNEVKNILVMREIRKNVDKLNRNHCYFEYGELKEVFNINNHLSYERHKKEIDIFKKKIMSCWNEFESEEIGIEMAAFTEVINDKKNRTITIKANPPFQQVYLYQLNRVL